VSGGQKGAEEGTLTLWLAGIKMSLKPVLHIQSHGADIFIAAKRHGEIVKIVNNLLPRRIGRCRPKG